MSETSTNPTIITPPAQVTIQPPSLQIGQRMLRSPSHESVTTDLSLFSISSSMSSNPKCANRTVGSFKSYSDVHLSARGPSPGADSSRLQIHTNRPTEIQEGLWFEEETDLIRSFGALSSALGLQKSFSTSDVSQLPINCPTTTGNDGNNRLRSAYSSHCLDLAYRGRLLLEQARLDHASRSCSTWVAVGDAASNSQLPSPHGGASLPLATGTTASLQLPAPGLPFTAADLVRSVNKKIRQNYIRRRLLTTYRALERLSQSEFNLDRLEVAAASATSSSPAGCKLRVPSAVAAALPTSSASAVGLLPGRKCDQDQALTVKDVERERGKQLSKYERNMMIFNWLHALEDSIEPARTAATSTTTLSTAFATATAQ